MQKRAIVTGASSGIGREIAKQLAEEGWSVLAVARRTERLKTLSQEWPDHIVAYTADITESDSPAKIINAAKKAFGGLDLLINNAGGSKVCKVVDMAEVDLDYVFNLNVRALIRLCQQAIPALEKSENGQIINIASTAAHIPMETIATYCAAKSAVVMFSKVLAKELAEKGIRVNVLSPCGTESEIYQKDNIDVNRNLLVTAEDMAQMAVLLTKLPRTVDISEVATHKRFLPRIRRRGKARGRSGQR